MVISILALQAFSGIAGFTAKRAGGALVGLGQVRSWIAYFAGFEVTRACLAVVISAGEIE